MESSSAHVVGSCPSESLPSHILGMERADVCPGHAPGCVLGISTVKCTAHFLFLKLVTSGQSTLNLVGCFMYL